MTIPQTPLPQTSVIAKPTIQPTWSGQVRITPDGEDFADDKPVPASGVFYSSTIRYDSSANTFIIEGNFALWLDGRDPSYEECLNQINTQPEAQQLRYKKGQGICDGFGDTVVFLRGTSEPGNAVEVNAIRWQKP